MLSSETPPGSEINELPWRLLCLSNGHGEDAIAVQVLQGLQRLPGGPAIAVLPLVGEGTVYRRAGFEIVGTVGQLPSGGFIYMDGGRQLLRDVRGGLVGLTRSQLRAVRQWVSVGCDRGERSAVLAVGDIVPLLFAHWSGAPYGFVGTAKSEYYLRGDDGRFLGLRWLEGWSGSVYLPWERWLMHRPRCRAVFPRDDLTVEVLRRCLPTGARSRSVPSVQPVQKIFNCGNPMMDGFAIAPELPAPPSKDAPVSVLLLPGSRGPEAYENWERIIAAADAIARQFPDWSWTFWAAVAPSLQGDRLAETLRDRGWERRLGPTADPTADPTGDGATATGNVQTWRHDHAELCLAGDRFIPWAEHCHFTIATAGTATEQVVGLGKPALTIPGNGPQFTAAFAEAQTRLLGPSAIACPTVAELLDATRSLLNDPEHWRTLAAIGRRRMGPPGAADRIARVLHKVLP